MTPQQPSSPPSTPCATCVEIPASVRVNTGRDEPFPAGYQTLERLGSPPGSSAPFRRCPACRTFFQWTDLPQVYGSGNCDEEQLDRLSPEVSSLLDRLFPAPTAGDAPAAAPVDVATYFARVPHELLVTALGAHVFVHAERVVPFVPGLTRALARGDDDGACTLLSNYQYGDPVRARALLALLDAPDSQPLSRAAQALRAICVETIGTARR